MEVKMSKNYTNYNKVSNSDNKINEENVNAYVEKDEIILDESLTKHIGNCSRVYVRATADKDSDPVDILDCGAEVYVLDTENGFTHVTCNSTDGWVMSEYLIGD